MLMKKFFVIALMAALAFPMMQAQQSFPTKARAKQALAGIRHTDRVVTNQPPVQFKASFNDPIPEGMAMVTLSAASLWSDGSGYQMLLDADATAYGDVFPEEGPLTQVGDAEAWVYDEFEYKIPENADGSCYTTNVVLDNSLSILIPAGVYDFVITNPSPGDRVWIASPYGNIGGRQDNFTFEAGKAYTFTVSMGDNGNDLVDLLVSGDETEPTAPTEVTVDPAATTATVEWSDFDDSEWNLRYRVYNPDADPEAQAFFWDFEDGMGDWTSIDADGDGEGWYLNDPLAEGYDPGDGLCLFGTRSATSASYDAGVLYPDNWLVSPQVVLDGQLSFWAAGQDPDWAEEVFAVYVTTGDPNDLDGYVKISEDITATSPIREYTFDLSNFAGQEGYVAFRHYNVSDMYRLNIDNVGIGTQSAPAPWIVVNGLTDNSYTIENLANGTTYEVQVQAVNGDATSEWTESTIFTTSNEQPITVVYVYGYESPVEGENAMDHLNITVPEDANYHIYVNDYSPEWWDMDIDDEFFDTFVGGTRYSLGMTLEANDGYYFADDCVFYVNGTQDLVDYNFTGVAEEGNTFAYLWTVPEVCGNETESFVITEVYVYGYESPVAGEDSQVHMNIVIPDDAKYSLYVHEYSPEWWDNDIDDEFFDVFVEGTYYSLGMTLEANEGYRFANDCKFYVNGLEELVDYEFTYVDDESNNHYAYLWTVPEAAQAALPSAIEETVSGKQVAGVRYYNLAGQEMKQADGMTIVVTTYTDGSTTAVKVMK